MKAEMAAERGIRSILLVAPTGAGKTRIGVEFCKRKRTLWLSHRQELVHQSVAALRRNGVTDVAILTAKTKTIPDERVIVASLQTLLAREWRPEADVVVFDEAHHFPSAEWKKLAEHYRGKIRIGLTATPERADGSPLGDLFEKLITVAGIQQLTQLGHLVPLEVQAGPYRTGRRLSQSPVDVFDPVRRTIVFVETVAYARAVQKEIGGECVFGSTPLSIRESTVERFCRGEVNPLINVGCLTEGFDAPATEVCILGRSCNSLPLYLQITGRVLRTAPGKTSATLFDLSGAVHAHGMPDSDRTYSLDGSSGISRKTTPSVWTCKQCGLVKATSPGKCPRCDYEPPFEAPKITGDKLKKIVPGISGPTIDDLRRKATNLGYKPGWAYYRFKALYGRTP